MALFGRKRVQPLECRWQDICDLMKDSIETNTPILDLTVRIGNANHRTGISADMTQSGEYFDIVFFFDDKEYPSLNEMISDLSYSFDMIVSVIKEENVVNPRDYTLLAQREIV